MDFQRKVFLGRDVELMARRRYGRLVIGLCWIGSGNSIRAHGGNVRLGARGRIPPFSIAVGAPARVIGSRLPDGMTAEEAIDLRRRGRHIPGDPLAS